MNLKGTTIRNWAERLGKYGLINSFIIFLNQKRDSVYRLRYRGTSFLLRGRSVDFHVFNSIFGQGEYDFDIGFVPEVIVDAGAYTGFSAIYFHRRFPQATIIAVEPEASNFGLLVRNSGTFGNIHPVRAGLYGCDTVLSIADSGVDKYAFSLRVSEGSEDSVPGYTVTRLMKEFGLARIDILKMDIEGAEFSVFMNQPGEWLPLVRMVIAEVHEHLHAGVRELITEKLCDAGFKIDWRGENLIASRPQPEELAARN
ncbi:MAG: FkbM family methyltransferase [Bacteroidales bacterium]